VTMNHHLLNALGVGHQALEDVLQTSAEMGFACKLTGAGGGGCAITLLTNVHDRDSKIDILKEKLR
jgi:mevalonate kinase